MTKDQLVAKFKEMREAGKAGSRKSAMGHLFGIIFVKEIAASGSNAAEIAREAGLRDGDDGGIRDGQNLAEYVEVKEKESAGALEEGSQQQRQERGRPGVLGQARKGRDSPE